ncbi:MAG: peptide chain release factor N(5)-glutamine methyltransferase [Candidatus Edwardsbacteria bacterium]|nr:peptide chain release factor N(5)-glutamine methyltransferase [Candidatus Edwardsbacteria bacterium]
MTIGQLLQTSSTRLKTAGIESAPFEAQFLLAHVLKHDRVWLTVNRDRAVSARDRKRFARFVRKRSSRKPLQYVLGETEFYGFKIFVNRHALIPRPETEILVEQVMKHWKPQYRSILDIGTGSGAIAVALAKNLPNARIVGTDLSARTMTVAKKNIEFHRLGKRAALVKADLFPPARTKFDCIVSNPPYIPSSELAALQPEVSKYEPWKALDGGKDGLEFYRRIITRSRSRLNKGGMIALEVGQGQANAVRDMFTGNYNVITLPDLCGVPRVVLAIDG